MDSLSIAPKELAALLKGINRRRAYFVYHEGASQIVASDLELQPMARAIQENRRDFASHEAIFLEVGKTTGALFGAFLHDTRRGQGAGGVRHWPYSSIGDFITDGLRLSRGMGRKNALAGLWWGGGKGVIARQEGDSYRDSAYRAALYREFGVFISSLRGAYVTAEDVGTGPGDMAQIYTTTRFTTCVPPSVGGSGNPSFATARGVVCAMQAATEFRGLGTLAGKRIAMQGTGNVGGAMIGELLELGVAKITATEISPQLRATVLEKYHDPRLEVRLVASDDTAVFSEDCDIFVPNALGGILGPETIPLLQASLVCGAANNQLLDESRDDLLLKQRGIVYVPDFVANRMGIVNCANEQYGSIPDDPTIARHFSRDWQSSIHNITCTILERAQQEDTTPARAANALADELMKEPHPIWGHRARQILDTLIRERWQEAGS